MGNVNYNQWINGNDCCRNNCGGDCNCYKDVCDCENILLEISKLHTDDEILQDEIDELSGKVETVSAEVDTKLDASAYTPVDLTDYYTKEEVDELIPEVPSLSGYATEQWVENQGYLTTVEPLKTINGESLIGEGNIVISGGSGGTVDAYTKAESDERFQPKGNYLSGNALNGYATEQWVGEQGYITGVDLSDYALKSEIPTVPTSNSAFTNDMHYVTSADTANYVTSGNVETQIVNHFWCGTQNEWALISGNTQPNVLYLIHD